MQCQLGVNNNYESQGMGVFLEATDYNMHMLIVRTVIEINTAIHCAPAKHCYLLWLYPVGTRFSSTLNQH